MRIRKGKRCLPLAPADRSFMQEPRGRGANDGKDCADQTLLRLIPAAPRSKGIIGSGAQYLDGNTEIMLSLSLQDSCFMCNTGNLISSMLRQEHANGTSPDKLKKCLEYDLEMNRVSAGGNSNQRSLIHDTDTDLALRTLTATSPRTESVFTKHKRSVTTGTLCSSTPATKIQDRPDLLEQSLCHIYSGAGKTGLSAHDAVVQILEQDLPGFIEGGERLIVQVAKTLRNSSKFLECEERGRFVLQDSSRREGNKSLDTGESKINREETVSSTDMIEAARQLQIMQKSHANSLGSGVVELSETSSFHGGNHKAVQNMTQSFVGQSKLGTNYTDVTAMNQKSSSSTSRSQNVTQTDHIDSQCKREDGKGWRCSQPAEGGYTMCGYHREQICRAQSRRKRPKSGVEPTFSAKCSPSRYVVNTRAVPNAIITSSDYSPFLDDELAYDERRQFVKAKSLKSLMLNKGVRPKVF